MKYPVEAMAALKLEAQQEAQEAQEKSDSFTEEVARKAAVAKATNPAAPTRTLWGDAWKRLRRNKLAMLGMVWIILLL